MATRRGQLRLRYEMIDNVYLRWFLPTVLFFFFGKFASVVTTYNYSEFCDMCIVLRRSLHACVGVAGLIRDKIRLANFVHPEIDT